jgi:uncharacterized cupredoxin-like copper-binding protein
VKRIVAACAFFVATVTFAVVTLVSTGGTSSGNGPGDAPPVLGPGPVTVRLVVRDSHFHLPGRRDTSPPRVHVRPHTDVTFVVDNRDFINHEFIIGGPDVHARHESGHEPWHPPVPGEVSIAAHTAGETTYSFHAPGTVLFACHLPGHFAYGMKGYVVVDA